MAMLRPVGSSLFSTSDLHAHALGVNDLPALQAFFEANPEYFIAVAGLPPRADEAQQEFDDRPPAGMPFGAHHLIGFVDPAGQLAGMASVLSDFLARGVWHIGLFIVATKLHGSSQAATMHQGLQTWMQSHGAQWIRLGAVVGNAKAERFWPKCGYTEVRQRSNVPLGPRTGTVRLFVKALDGQGLGAYMALVERDRPDSLLP